MIQHRRALRLVTTGRQPRRLAFTARSILRIKPEAQSVDWFDKITPGLALRMTPHGARTWYLFYQKASRGEDGKTRWTTRRVKLGTWPALELAKARKLARADRVRVETTGADPAHERQDARNVFTVGDLAKLYLEQYAMMHKRTWKDDYWRFERYVLPAWKSCAIGDISRGDVHVLLDKIAADGKPVQANRVQALVSKLWNFAIDREHATTNPCYRMSKVAPERIRATVLTDEALRGLWRALEATPGDASDALRLRLLTGQRGGEVHGLRWSELDLRAGVWTIPAERAKNGRAHRVPLSKPVLEVLRARNTARPKDQARVFPNLYHQRADLRAFATIHHGAYRWHDLRRTVATRLAEIGVNEKTIGRVLGHAERGVTATIYNQYAYDAEQRAGLDAWAGTLQAIVNADGADHA